jgi:hypothetical protein
VRSTAPDSAVLAEMPLFKDLPAGELSRLVALMHEKSFPAGGQGPNRRRAGRDHLLHTLGQREGPPRTTLAFFIPHPLSRTNRRSSHTSNKGSSEHPATTSPTLCE